MVSLWKYFDQEMLEPLLEIINALPTTEIEEKNAALLILSRMEGYVQAMERHEEEE